MHTTPKVERRALLTGAAIAAVASAVRAQTQPQPLPTTPAATRLDDAPLAPATTVTVERRGEIVLIGLNRPAIQNRVDPPTRARLADVFYRYEHDPSLRAAVLFGHGEQFTRGIDVDAFQAALDTGIAMARKIAACAPLSIKATLASAHQVIDPVEADALSKLDAAYSTLYRTEDFIEGRRAEAEGRPPKYHGR